MTKRLVYDLVDLYFNEGKKSVCPQWALQWAHRRFNLSVCPLSIHYVLTEHVNEGSVCPQGFKPETKKPAGWLVF